jgi:hypothetical protein
VSRIRIIALKPIDKVNFTVVCSVATLIVNQIVD